MNHTNAFDIDLAKGQVFEQFVADLLTGKETIEVKADAMAHQTGNVFVEYESRGKLSGIATTRADFWAFVIQHTRTVIMMPTPRLKEIARKHWQRRAWGGDGNTSAGVLVPVRELVRG